jgi:hypothetical protein
MVLIVSNLVYFKCRINCLTGLNILRLPLIVWSGAAQCICRDADNMHAVNLGQSRKESNQILPEMGSWWMQVRNNLATVSNQSLQL